MSLNLDQILKPLIRASIIISTMNKQSIFMFRSSTTAVSVAAVRFVQSSEADQWRPSLPAHLRRRNSKLIYSILRLKKSKMLNFSAKKYREDRKNELSHYKNLSEQLMEEVKMLRQRDRQRDEQERVIRQEMEGLRQALQVRNS